MANEAQMALMNHIETQTRMAEAPPPNNKHTGTADIPPSQQPKKIKRRRPWKLYGVLLLLAAAAYGFAYGYCNYVYGKGGYSGYVRMIHRVGAIKTWEGELDKRKLGGAYDEKDIFNFSIQDEAVAKKVEDAEQSGQWVTVHYKQFLVALPWRGKTPFIVNDVTHADPQKPMGN